MTRFPSLVIFDKEVREKLLTGINILADAVGSTLGPKGRNVGLNEAAGPPLVLHDGVGVAKRIDLIDEFEDMGAQIIKQAAEKTNETAGDGTTTATIIAQSLINKALQDIQSGVNPMTLKKEIEDSFKVVMDELNKMAIPISTPEEIVQVATISSANKGLGKLVAEAIGKVGKDGVIMVEEGKGFETEVEYKQGMEIDRGYLSPYFKTDEEKVVAIVENPKILITDIAINHNHEFIPFIERFLKVGNRNLVIIGEVVEEALATLVVNKLKGNINICAIQAPAFGDRRVDELQDIAILTGGTAILKDSGREIKSVEMEELGSCNKFTADRDKSIIQGGGGSKKAVKARMKELREQIKVKNTDFDGDIKQQRLAKLSGGVAVINVGAATEVELKDKKERTIDAVNATKAAVEEGIVAGGEMALLSMANEVDSHLLGEALKAPFRKLVENAGMDYAEVWGEISPLEYPYGIDVMDGEKKDLIEAGIIDPVKVVKSALQNAVSAAVMAMTTSCLVSMPYDPEK